MKISIGTQPVHIYGLANTASDFVWTQCLPCDACFNQINPKFDPQKSSTYSEISCHSEQCHQTETTTCSPQNICNYDCGYATGLTKGVMAKEKATITSTSGKVVSFDTTFGCGHNNFGLKNDHSTRIIGLAPGPLTFTSQIGSSSGSKSFSSCLLPFSTHPYIESKISFGNGSKVVGDGVVSTPLVAQGKKDDHSSLNYVTLEGISFGGTYVPFNSSGNVSEGNTLIDSGIPTLVLPLNFYDRIVVEVKKQISIDPIKDPILLETYLCYRTKINNQNGPVLTVHFEGADVELMPIQTFSQPLKQHEIYCFGITSSSNTALAGWDSVRIYGNFVQANFLIGFDRETMMLPFKRTDCNKQ